MSADDRLGCWKSGDGFAFRVWAPNAESVSVVGSFNAWDGSQNVMSKDDKGYWSAEISNVKFQDEYRYEISFAGTKFTRVDPYARHVTNSVGNAIVTDLRFEWGDDSYRLPPRNEIVIYEMHVGTFNASGEGQPGTFDTAIEKLDHLVALGVNAVEVMPCAEFAGDLSWGYNPAHIFAVEGAYGGPMALKRFILECHRRKIGVIMDVVYNHFGPSDLSLWQFDGWSENGKGGIYFYNDWRSSTPWGDSRPDYGRGEVRKFIVDNARYWLEEFHCDGLRFDMTLYIRHVKGDGDPGAALSDGWSLTQEINNMVHRDFPHALTIAEDLQDCDALTKRTDEGGAGFNVQWDARFVHPIRRLVCTPKDEERSLHDLVHAATATYNGDSFERVVYSESHDEVANGKARVTSEVDSAAPESWHAKKRSTLAAALALTVPGVPMLFQGQELLETEWFRDTDPIDWSRAKEFSGILQMYRDLIHLRTNTGGLSKGLTGSGFKVLYEHHEDHVIAFHRWYTSGVGDDVVVLFNLSAVAREAVPVAIPKTGKWQMRFNSDWSGYSSDFSDYSSNEMLIAKADGDVTSFHLAPYSIQILVFAAPFDAKQESRTIATESKVAVNQ